MKKQLFSLALAAALAISTTSLASPLHIAKQRRYLRQRSLYVPKSQQRRYS